MEGRDASHDASHAFRVRDLALSLASAEDLLSDQTSKSDSLETVELAALLHDIGDYKYMKNSVEDTSIVECFLEEEGLEKSKRETILSIIKWMGYKNEVSQTALVKFPVELGVVQDADRLDAIGAIEKYMDKDEKQTTVNHFYEKLFKLKDLMKTEAGKRRAEKRHRFMQDFLREFFQEWEGKVRL